MSRKERENSENKWTQPGDLYNKENKLRYKGSHSKTPRCALSLSVCMYVFMYIPQEGKKRERVMKNTLCWLVLCLYLSFPEVYTCSILNMQWRFPFQYVTRVILFPYEFLFVVVFSDCKWETCCPSNWCSHINDETFLPSHFQESFCLCFPEV